MCFLIFPIKFSHGQMSFRAFFTLASAVECRSIPSIKTLDRHPDRYLIDTRSTPQLILNQHSVDISIDSFGFDQGRAYRYISSYARMSTLLTTLSGLASYRQLYRGIFADIIVFIFPHLHTALRAKGNMLDINCLQEI